MAANWRCPRTSSAPTVEAPGLVPGIETVPEVA